MLLAAGESGDAVVVTTCFHDAKPLGQHLFFLTCTAPGLWSTDGTSRGHPLLHGLQVDTYRILADQLGPIGSTTLIPMPGYYSARACSRPTRPRTR